MSNDYETHLRELANEMDQEEAGLQIVGRALTEAEIRRTEALRQARELVEQAIHALAAADVPAELQDHTGGLGGVGEHGGLGGVGTPPPSIMREEADLDGIHFERPMENFGLAGDEDMPGYGRGGGGRP